MIDSRLLKLEQQLLCQPECIFSAQEFAMMAQAIRSDTNPNAASSNFRTYLLGIIAYHTADFEQARALFGQLKSRTLPKQSQAFLAIFRCLLTFQFQPAQTFRLLAQNAEKLPRDLYGYLLARLVITAHRRTDQKARYFYFHLQLMELLPTLPITVLSAQVLFECGVFYLNQLQNTQLAQSAFLNAKKILTTLAENELPLVMMLTLYQAQIHMINNDLSLALADYETFLAQEQSQIDYLFYHRALVNAINIYIAKQQFTEALRLRTYFAQLKHIPDIDKKNTLLFGENYAHIMFILAQPEIDFAKLETLIQVGEQLLDDLKPNLVSTPPQIVWFRIRGDIAVALNDYDTANYFYHQALQSSKTHNQVHYEAMMHSLLAQNYAKLNQFKQAVQHFQANDALQIGFFNEQNNNYLITLQSRFNNKTLESLLREHKQQHDLLENRVLLDELTNLYNRYYLEQLQRALPPQYQLAIIDIDYFKQYNDYYGHLAGDYLLRDFAKLLQIYFPNYKIIRYGGEEFLLVALNEQFQHFQLNLKLFQKQLRKAHFAHQGLGPKAYVTASIGHTASTAMTTFQQELEAADQALYRAKKAGRDQIRFQALTS